ncbi:hypothetical protein NHQ30_009105 [Ciborinia camelliae]|nr:hypothetical protein NHQ30_009105 [Ciborinia camelliae]
MTSSADTEYPLERDPLSSSRLYLQHYLWQRLVGHLLHPSIPIKEKAKIADIACGTGIWLLDLAKELARSNKWAQLDGFDISTTQYPPSALLPPNVKLDTLDIFEPIPEQLRGQYDVIHISLLCLVIRDGDPRPVLDNVLTWIRQLRSIFQEREITILEDQILVPEAEIAYAWTLMHMDGIKELVKVAAGGSREGMELHRRAADEVRRGACVSMMLVNVVGRKAGGD